MFPHSRADDGQLNFQKASCALDASVKIYSYRVDDTWTTSYRVLENLNRTDKKDDDGSFYRFVGASTMLLTSVHLVVLQMTTALTRKSPLGRYVFSISQVTQSHK
jgi:hypothetical protein